MRLFRVCLSVVVVWAGFVCASPGAEDVRGENITVEPSLMPDKSEGAAVGGMTWRERLSDLRTRATEGVGNRFQGDRTQSVWDVLDGHLEIGARITKFDLDETTRPPDETQVLTFLGRVNQLEDEQDNTPKLNILVLPIPYLGLEYTYDQVAARTRNFNTGLSDGVLEMSGPIWSLILRYPFRHDRMTWIDAITPWVGYGKASWDADFKHEAWWTHGWSTPEDYIAAGSPTKDRHGASRVITVDGDSSTVLSYGVIIQVTENLGVDVMWRSLELTAEAAYYRNGDFVHSGAFPMDHSTMGWGARYAF